MDRPRTPLASIKEVDEPSPEDIQDAMDKWQQTLYNERMRMMQEEAKSKMFAKVKDG
jgi:hypothetical protein